LKENKSVILDIDMQGVIQLKNKLANNSSLLGKPPIYIFLCPPSMKVLEERLRSRGTETEETLAPRLKAASDEMKWGQTPGNCDFIIKNEVLETAFNELVSCLKTKNILS
jgi:guanylate kinase